MKIKSIAWLINSALVLGAFTLRAADVSAQKPNIIFILADDLGIGSVSSYGADNFKTPNIDKLADSGIRFEHCYSSPLCGPSRALLMTGRYPCFCRIAQPAGGETDVHIEIPAEQLRCCNVNLKKYMVVSGYMNYSAEGLRMIWFENLNPCAFVCRLK